MKLVEFFERYAKIEEMKKVAEYTEQEKRMLAEQDRKAANGK